MIYDITPAAGARITVEDGGSLTINAEANSGLKYSAGSAHCLRVPFFADGQWR